MKKYIIKIKGKIIALITYVVSGIFILVPIKNNKCVFISDTRDELGGNLKIMHDYIPSSYEKIVILKHDRRTKRTFKDKINLLLNLSDAKYIFLEDLVQTTSNFNFKKSQKIVQLWHGAGAFKKFGYDRAIENGGEIKKVHGGYKKYTNATVSSESIRKDYANAFGISIDKVQATGFLRTDMFFDDDYINLRKKEIYKKYPYLKKKKVILFAPTYRGAPYKNVDDGGANYDFSKIDFNDMYEKLKDEYIVVFKWHPALYNNIENGQIDMPNLKKFKNFYYDLSDVRDINDLLLVTDLLITDYSSVVFDYVLVDKPIVYFVYDLEDYENGRGMYYPFKDYVYGEISKDSKSLVKAIKEGKMMSKKRERFVKKFMAACDGNSTKKTYEWIFNDK